MRALEVTHHEARLPGARIHYVEAGPADGPLVLLLHGFPELWYSWRYQIPALAAAGFRVVAPDQRGYGTSSKPSGVESYAVGRIARARWGLTKPRIWRATTPTHSSTRSTTWCGRARPART